MLIKIYLFLLGLLFFTTSSFAQTDLGFGDRFILGSSAGYLNHINPVYKDVVYHEIHWDKKAMVSLNPSFYAGIRWLSVFTRGSSVIYQEGQKDNYYVVGAFSEFDVIPETTHRLFIRLSYNYGNICICGIEDPYKVDGLHYPAIAIGTEYYFTKLLAVSIEGENLLILPRSERPTNFVRYGVGLKMRIDVE